MKNFKAFIFDLDGVLIDTEPVFFEHMKGFLESKNFDISNLKFTDVVGTDAQSRFKALSKKIPNFYKDIDTFRSEFKKFKKDYKFDYKTVVFDGVYDILEDLKNKGYKIALASSSYKDTIKKVMDELNFYHYFDFVISGEDLKESKPNPEIYLKTVEELGLIPDECLVVEDSTTGIKAAKSAGLYTVAIKDKKFYIDQSQADICISSISELKNFY